MDIDGGDVIIFFAACKKLRDIINIVEQFRLGVDEYLTQCNTIKVEFNIDKVFVLKRGLPVIIVTFYKGVRKYLWSPLK